MNDLTPLERRVTKMQVKLIEFGKEIEQLIENPTTQNYARELAETYYPKNRNPDYLEPIITSFAADLVTAPRHHSKHYLWKYNYDDLDFLSKFYKLSTPTKKYFHLAAGTLPTPTLEVFKKGCEILKLELGKYAHHIYEIYELGKAKSRVAARIVETIAGAEHDFKMNTFYGFDLDESKRNLMMLRGLGKFQYLRKGNIWIALGSAQAKGTRDLRKEVIEFYDYTATVYKGRLSIKVHPDQLETLKADLKNILDSDAAMYYRLKKANEHFKAFHFKRRFANATDWNQIDFWFNRYSAKKRKSHPKLKAWTNYNASKNKHEATYIPRRTNFFWNPSEELHCDFKKIWNPHSK
jgi:hypothetical protein